MCTPIIRVGTGVASLVPLIQRSQRSHAGTPCAATSEVQKSIVMTNRSAFVVMISFRPPMGSILLVKDDDRVASLVTEMFLELGYRVTRVASAQAALGALADDSNITW